ncbi:hypothetical protein LOTGIDRAFT_175982 [Lottia gigantea]|uniref:DNA-directed DNA polymerase n=1 Tax=Lottia gigantea TaxID=225164 RepID=V3ZRC7_LOTGI|nr:hypothetical protein LOTGIDRAFT_175982 [Lottia gigantea]ESO86882.1 hypothetical protein LOTGIDRAFT_175982 [Lottia gigantea]
MTTARICEFNKKFNTNFQIYMPKHRHFQPKKVTEELDWVLYLHKEHFCLIRRNNKALGIKEIEDNYDENVWRTCEDDNAVTQVSPLKLNVFPTIPDYCLYAWDCETYCEKETNKAIPYCCTLVNLEKLRKRLDDYNNYLSDLSDFNENLDFKPSDPISEEYYNILMTNIVEIFVGTDCIDQMLQRLGKVDQKRLTLISHNGSGSDNWIMIKNVKKQTQFPLKTARGIHSLPLTNSFTDEDLQKKWKRQKEIKEYNESNTEGIIDLFKEYSVNPEDKTEVRAKLKELDYSKLMAFDANGLYASAMTEGEYPKAESARAFLPEEEKEFVKLFNKQKFRPRTAILKVWFEYPKNMFFQPIPAKDKITFTNRIGKKETGTKIRFRNGFCHDVLTSVDIQEIVKSGGKIIRILDGIVYEENFKTPPYRDYILILKELRNKYKKEGDMVASNCMKLLGNSLYGKSIQKDINTSRHLWSESTFKANFDSHVKSYEKVNDSQYIVEMNEEEKEFVPPKDFTRLTPAHLGAFIYIISQ